MSKAIAPLGATLLLAGCLLVPQAAQTTQRGTLVLQPQIQGGELRTQAELAPLTPADVHHLLVKVYPLSGNIEAGAPIIQDIPKERFVNPVTINNLQPNHTYRIWCHAYKAPGTNEYDRISTLDSLSYTDVTLGIDDQPTLATIKVQLLDTYFCGETSTELRFSPGDMVASGSPTLTVR